MSFTSSTVVHASDREPLGKFAIDTLFEKSRQKNLHQVHLYNLILQRVHRLLKIAGKTQLLQQIVYQVPMFMFSEPHYNVSECMMHLTHSIEADGFAVQFSAPNNLYISWAHWIPDYVRQEYQKQTGNKIDGRGNITVAPVEETTPAAPVKQPKEYLSTAKNRPGAMVYPSEYFDKISRSAGGPS
jgi:hypothetical protein